MAGVDLTRINTNIAAMNTLNSLRDVNKNLAIHQSRLASGKRINEAADDPAGLTLATKFDVRARSLQQAMDNIGDAKNLMSVAEGGLKKVSEILGKMRIKAEQAASDALGTDERTAIQGDLTQYSNEIADIVKQTSWNNKGLLSGSVSFSLQTGASTDSQTTFALASNYSTGSGGSLNNLASTDVSSANLATTYMGNVDTAITSVSSALSYIGAMSDRLSFKEDALAISKVNTEAAYNRIMNADMADEQLNTVKYQILQQTATSMLAQANQAPQSIMQLFR